MKKKLIIGNWKMNKNPIEIKEYINELKDEINKGDINCDFGIAPSSINIVLVKYLLKGFDNVIISSQDAHWDAKGAFTGNDSWSQIKECGINWSIIGHSERRQFFGETDETVNKKVKSLVDNDMIPILCVGELLNEREESKHFEIVSNQIEKAYSNIDSEKAMKIVIAYEPVWAIGTGKSASSQDAQEMCEFIRNKIRELYNDEVASETKILYGGSVNTTNVKEYLSNNDIDGALVGGASLIASDFMKLVRGIN